MTRLSPQVLVQLARRMVERELKWTRTELHAPPIPVGAVTDDPLAELSPLDVRLIQQLGFRAYHNAATQRSDWPLPLGLTAYELALYGEGHGILHEQPESGDIFLQRALMGRAFVHAGLVMTVDHDGCLNDHTIYYDTSTVEGDTDHRGLLGRGYTGKLRRRLSPTLGDRFLRWCDLPADSPSSLVA